LLPSLAPVGAAESAPSDAAYPSRRDVVLAFRSEQFLSPHLRQRSSWLISRRTAEVKRLARGIEAAAMDVTLRVAMFVIPTRRRALAPARCLV